MSLLFYIYYTFSFIIHLPPPNLYITANSLAMPSAGPITSAIQIGLSEPTSQPTDLVLQLGDGDLAFEVDKTTNNVIYNRINWQRPQIFTISTDLRTGLKRIINSAKCMEWLPTENIFRMRPCIHDDNQLYELIDVGPETLL